MKYCLLSLVLTSLHGCTTIRYQDGPVTFTRTSFGTQLQVNELRASINQSGQRKIEMVGYTSDQVESLKAVAEGVAKGLAEGAKP